MKLSGRVAIVTGAGSGIGRASALLFAGEGARIVAVDRDAAGLGETLAACATASAKPGSPTPWRRPRWRASGGSTS